MKKLYQIYFFMLVILFFSCFINYTEASINHGEAKQGRYTRVDTPKHAMDNVGSNILCSFYLFKGWDINPLTYNVYDYHKFYITFFCNRTQKDNKYLMDKKRSIVVQIGNQSYTLKNEGYKIHTNEGYVEKWAELSGFCVDGILNEVKNKGASFNICFIVPLVNGNSYHFYLTKSEISEFIQGLVALK